MGRPLKTGLDFFPMNTCMNDNIELVQMECGYGSLEAIVQLWQKIYFNGYYIKWDEDIKDLFVHKTRIEPDFFDRVMSACFRRNIFDKKLFDKYQILTSLGVQKRYLKICSDAKRTNYEIDPRYKLSDLDLFQKKSEETPKFSEVSTQSKVKETRENNISNNTLCEEHEEALNMNERFDREKFFDKCWSKYPEKKGKGSIKESHKEEIFKLGDEFIRCIDRYVEMVECRRNSDFPDMHYQNGATFFKTGYVDYLDDNYQPPSKKTPKKSEPQNKFHNFEQSSDEYTNDELEVLLGIRKKRTDSRIKDEIGKGG